MKLKPLFLTTCFTVAIAFGARATTNSIPNCGFEGMSTNFTYPTIGSVNYGAGAWNFQLTGVLTAFGGVQIGTQAAIATASGSSYVPAPVQGTNEVAISFPVGLAVKANLSQTLTNAWLPNSTYILTTYVASSATASLLSGANLSLKSGSTSLSSQSVVSVLNLFAVSNVYQPVVLTYKTGNSAPSGNVALSLDFPNALQVGGGVYVDNFSLSIAPNNIQLVTSKGTNSTGGRTMNFSATGGAPSENYKILTTTNILQPSVNWATWTNAQFDTSGNFNQQITIITNEPYRFFRVQLP